MELIQIANLSSKNIADKKISFFLDYIRNKYFIKTSSMDAETIQKIADKSSISTGSIKSLLGEIEKINHNQKITEEDLENINFQIEKFYERTK